MSNPVAKKWTKKYISIPRAVSGAELSSFTVRTDGEVIQKEVSKTIYEAPYAMPIDKWVELLHEYSDGLIEPNITVRSYDGGERGGYYEGPSSETVITGWVEGLTQLELKLAKEMIY